MKQIVYTVLASICMVLLANLLCVLWQVYRKIRFSNNIILIMIVFLNLDIICVGQLFSFNAWVCYVVKNQIKLENLPPEWYIVILPLLPPFFFDLSVILNLNIWCRYYLKICELSSSSNKYKKHLKVLNFVTFVYVMATFILFGLDTYY